MIPPYSSVAGAYVFAGGRLWLDFSNSSDARRERGHDALRTFGALLRWLEAAEVIDEGRAYIMRRRAEQQPAGAQAILQEARRIRDGFVALAASGAISSASRDDACTEINRVLGRSTGVRRLTLMPDGSYMHSFVPSGDAFATLLVPIVESAADSLAAAEFYRVRQCAGEGCERVFLDETRNGTRKWCVMEACGNREKARRFRERSAG
ncbi:MAG TPA: CGNR zinc finger domain-containing protein [Gemmatimonadales bacterium]|nr:CGNR zinc finger domain-containing protein [Gemmatimonadales bacterium]